MIARMFSAAILGIEGQIIEIEISCQRGMPNFILVGLPDVAIKESRERVKSAIVSSHYKFPSKRIVINMAPADLKKEGTLYDLPLALAILYADGLIEASHLSETLIVGELSLDGRVKAVKGLLPMLIEAQGQGFVRAIVPQENLQEASVLETIEVHGVSHLREAVDTLWKPFQQSDHKPKSKPNHDSYAYDIDFSDVKGQAMAKRALEIAASGGHNVLLIGPPGSGKSMLAKRLRTILPLMDFDEALQATNIHSVMGLLKSGQSFLSERPFRSPHHSVSHVGLVGGGSQPAPGEISLAHHGVLFLDELPEFQRSALEVLRQPLEDHRVTITRASGTMNFPASFTLVAAMNPCPCGYLGDEHKSCSCTINQIQKYMAKVSGPLMDRIDLHVQVPAIRYEDMTAQSEEESSLDIRKRVEALRALQNTRFDGRALRLNARMNEKDLKRFCQVAPKAQRTLKMVINELGFSARGYSKVLKIARTIADMQQAEQILEEHVLEAVQYRCLDQSYFP